MYHQHAVGVQEQLPVSLLNDMMAGYSQYFVAKVTFKMFFQLCVHVQDFCVIVTLQFSRRLLSCRLDTVNGNR